MAAKLRIIGKPHGFTLVEVLMAITILSVGILAWVSTQNQNLQSRTTSGHLNTAVELAEGWLEEKSAEVRGWNASHTSTSNNFQQSVSGIPYTLTWAVTNGDQMVPGGLTFWELDVQVDWTHFGAHSVQFRRIVIGD